MNPTYTRTCSNAYTTIFLNGPITASCIGRAASKHSKFKFAEFNDVKLYCLIFNADEQLSTGLTPICNTLLLEDVVDLL